MAKKILIADDEPDILKIVQFRLSKLGHEIITALDGQEAIDKAVEMKPDLVILDYRMPYLTGEEVCRLIKAHKDLQATKVMIMSASTNTLNELTLVSMKADAHIVKPFEPQELLKKVKELLGV